MAKQRIIAITFPVRFRFRALYVLPVIGNGDGWRDG